MGEVSLKTKKEEGKMTSQRLTAKKNSRRTSLKERCSSG